MSNYMEKDDVPFNFEDFSILHDRVLSVGERKFHVVSGVLSLRSEHFRGLFSGNLSECNTKETNLEDLDADVFETFLRVIYEYCSPVLRVDDIIPLIQLSYRFLAPMVLKRCREFIDNNFDKLDNIKLQLLETACTYGNEGLKEKLINNLKVDTVTIGLRFTEILELASKHKLMDLKSKIVSYMRDHISYENCSEYLDFCDKFDLPKLKDEIVKSIEQQWNFNEIHFTLLIELTKTVFKHDLHILKDKILRLWNKVGILTTFPPRKLLN